MLQQWLLCTRETLIDGVRGEREARSLGTEALIILWQEAFCILFVITNPFGEWPCFS